MAPGKRGLRVLNNRQARQAAFDILRTVVSGQKLLDVGQSRSTSVLDLVSDVAPTPPASAEAVQAV
jgi:hypothetical protein